MAWKIIEMGINEVVQVYLTPGLIEPEPTRWSNIVNFY